MVMPSNHKYFKLAVIILLKRNIMLLNDSEQLVPLCLNIVMSYCLDDPLGA